MAYTIQSIVSDISQKENIERFGLKEVHLNNSIYMIPLPYEFIKKFEMSFLPLVDEGRGNLGDNLQELCLSFSKRSKIAYIEAEYFGGNGSQGCVLFENGEILVPPQSSETAINHALRWLGVRASETNDEFDAVGLGKHRSTEDW